jgi:hypothetical protein
VLVTVSSSRYPDQAARIEQLVNRALATHDRLLEQALFSAPVDPAMTWLVE